MSFCRGRASPWAKGCRLKDMAAQGEMTVRNRTSRKRVSPARSRAVIAPWERFVIGLDKALEQFQRDNPNGVSGAPARDSASDRSDSPPAATRQPRVGRRA